MRYLAPVIIKDGLIIDLRLRPCCDGGKCDAAGKRKPLSRLAAGFQYGQPYDNIIQVDILYFILIFWVKS